MSRWENKIFNFMDISWCHCLFVLAVLHPRYPWITQAGMPSDEHSMLQVILVSDLRNINHYLLFRDFGDRMEPSPSSKSCPSMKISSEAFIRQLPLRHYLLKIIHSAGTKKEARLHRVSLKIRPVN